MKDYHETKYGIALDAGLDNYGYQVLPECIAPQESSTNPYWIKYFNWTAIRNDSVMLTCVLVF